MRSVSIFWTFAKSLSSEFIAITQKEYEKVGTLRWAVSHSIIPLHYLQQPSMNKFIKLLRSWDNIKAGNLISLFIYIATDIHITYITKCLKTYISYFFGGYNV